MISIKSNLFNRFFLTSTLGHPENFSKNFHQIKKQLFYVFRLRALFLWYCPKSVFKYCQSQETFETFLSLKTMIIFKIKFYKGVHLK